MQTEIPRDLLALAQGYVWCVSACGAKSVPTALTVRAAAEHLAEAVAHVDGIDGVRVYGAEDTICAVAVGRRAVLWESAVAIANQSPPTLH